MDTKKYSEFKDKIVENVSKVMVGKNDVVELIVVSFIINI